jgi:hypothetical protein
MNMLDPRLGGTIRLVIRVLSFAVAALSSPQFADFHFTWVAGVLGAVSVVLDALTHLTNIGNTGQGD